MRAANDDDLARTVSRSTLTQRLLAGAADIFWSRIVCLIFVFNGVGQLLNDELK